MIEDGNPLNVNLPLQPLLQMLANRFQPPDRLRELQTQALELDIAQRITKGTVPYEVVDWHLLAAPVECATVISGAIGSGKTALACALAQLTPPVYALDWPDSASLKELGFQHCDWHTAERLQDATLLVDEARISTKDVDLWKTISLARHRALRLVYTTQTLASISRDVLRLSPRLLFKRTPPLAAAFEREELLPIASVASLLTIGRPPGWLACCEEGRWACSEAPLPTGWTDAASRNRRRGLWSSF